MRRPLALLAGLCLAPLPAAASYVDGATAIMQGLDKITARVWTFEVPLNQPTRFGTLQIQVAACRKRPPEEPPEAAGFVQVVDERGDRPAQQLFKGWMFASSPALSALEHPVYDVWMVDCKGGAAAAVSPPVEQPPQTQTPPARRAR